MDQTNLNGVVGRLGTNIMARMPTLRYHNDPVIHWRQDFKQTHAF
jgi:hypothetical protein